MHVERGVHEQHVRGQLQEVRNSGTLTTPFACACTVDTSDAGRGPSGFATLCLQASAGSTLGLLPHMIVMLASAGLVLGLHRR